MIALALLAACDQRPASANSNPLPDNSKQIRLEEEAHAFEMSERCGRSSREWFRQFFGDGTQSSYSAQTQSGYINHYNAGQNHCLALLTTTGSIKDSKTGHTSVIDSKSLVDVNDNKEIGNYYRFITPDRLMMCDMDGRRCAAPEEWDNWAKPYMEQ